MSIDYNKHARYDTCILVHLSTTFLRFLMIFLVNLLRWNHCVPILEPIRPLKTNISVILEEIPFKVKIRSTFWILTSYSFGFRKAIAARIVSHSHTITTRYAQSQCINVSENLVKILSKLQNIYAFCKVILERPRTKTSHRATCLLFTLL